MNETLSLQKVFDRSVGGVIAQGGASLGTGGRCAYRGRDGRRCAVGHLIEDRHYDPGIENLAIDATGVLHALVSSGVPREAFDVLDDLQSIAHDTCAYSDSVGLVPRADSEFLGLFRAEARNVAKNYGLSAEVAA